MTDDLIKNIDFYLDRLNWYHHHLKKPWSGGEKYSGYGRLLFFMTRDQVQWTYDFWREGLTGYIKREINRKPRPKKKDKEKD